MLNGSITQVLMEVEGKDILVWPKGANEGVKPLSNKYCHFHNEYRHHTNDCQHLKNETERLIWSGYLQECIYKENKRGRGPYKSMAQKSTLRKIGDDPGREMVGMNATSQRKG